MLHREFVLTLDQRDAILRAVRAIERRVAQMAGTSGWQDQYVVGTNLSIIQGSLTNLPLTGPDVDSGPR